MMNEKIIGLSKVRLENAKQCLCTSRVNLEINDYKASANRSYYAIFHSMRAVLALDNYDSKKHSGVIAEFRRKYIKTGILPCELSHIISRLFQIRTESDYNDFYLISKTETKEQLESAEKFVNTDLLKAESQSKNDLLNLFKELGYEIKL